MMDINKVILIGRLTRDPELKSTNSGTLIARFSLAVNGYKNEVGFFDCIAWGKQAETINQYLTKGKRVGIDGSLKFSSWEKDGQKRSKVEINVNTFQFLDHASNSEPQDNRDQISSVPMGALSNPDDVFGNPPMTDEDIPF